MDLFVKMLRRAGYLLALLTIGLMMANAQCYLRCNLAPVSAKTTHCNEHGKTANSPCSYQHAISKTLPSVLPDLYAAAVAPAASALSVPVLSPSHAVAECLAPPLRCPESSLAPLRI